MSARVILECDDPDCAMTSPAMPDLPGARAFARRLGWDCDPQTSQHWCPRHTATDRYLSPWDCDERGHVPTADGCLNCGASPHHGLPCCGHRLIQHTDAPNGYGNTDRCRCCRDARAASQPEHVTASVSHPDAIEQSAQERPA